MNLAPQWQVLCLALDLKLRRSDVIRTGSLTYSPKIMALYQITFCYPYLKEYAITVHHIRNEIETLSGSNWRIVSSGEHVCAIVFETDVESEQLVSTLGNYGSDDFQFLLTEIAMAIAGYLPSDVWEWVDSRFPRTLKLL